MIFELGSKDPEPVWGLSMSALWRITFEGLGWSLQSEPVCFRLQLLGGVWKHRILSLGDNILRDVMRDPASCQVQAVEQSLERVKCLPIKVKEPKYTLEALGIAQPISYEPVRVAESTISRGSRLSKRNDLHACNACRALLQFRFCKRVCAQS